MDVHTQAHEAGWEHGWDGEEDTVCVMLGMWL